MLEFRETKSRSDPDYKPTEADIVSLEYDLSKAAIFHSEPLTVEVEGWDEPVTVGKGYGGFGWSIFQRGDSCTACGNCCHHTFRRVWFWMPGQPKPEGLPELNVKINGVEKIMPYHMQDAGMPGERCDYLEPYILDGKHVTEVNDIPMWVCTLHRIDESPLDQQDGVFRHREDLKPVHCRMSPFFGIYKVNTRYGILDILSRRLPSRNWRWPKCPIPVYDLRMTREIAQNDSENLQMLYDAYGDLPGSKMGQGLELWMEKIEESLDGNPPLETIYFKELDWN